MIKKIIVIAVIIIMSSYAFADSTPPYVMIGNALKLTGGNDAVFVTEHDATSNEYDEPEEESPMPEVTIMAQDWSKTRVPERRRPSVTYGLLNPSEPVEVTAYGDNFSIGSWGGDDIRSVRLLDSDGSVLEEFSNETDKAFIQPVKLTDEPKTCYIEFMRSNALDDDALQEYCYVLLTAKSGRERKINPAAKTIEEIYQEFSTKRQPYTENNVKTPDDNDDDNNNSSDDERPRRIIRTIKR